jgi:uncharacterized protein
MAQHRIVRVEIPAADPQKLGDFYQQAFGWTLRLDPIYNYMRFAGDGGPGGALVPNQGEFWAGAGPHSPIVYVSSDDIDADLAAIEAAGGKTLAPKAEIFGLGWVAVFRDPSGNHLGLYQYEPPSA